MNRPFTHGQKRVFVLCFLCYTAAYTGRLNLSAALRPLADSLSLTDTRAGVFQTAFALVYAAGQMINGSLVDRISARRYIGLGLLLSALCNALFGLAQNFGVLAALWALNGAAQSMLWTPIVKLLAAWFHGERRARASFGLSVGVIFGHLAAWALSGALTSAFGWRRAFLIPAGVMTVACALAWLMLRDCPGAEEEGMIAAETSVSAPDTSAGPDRPMPIGAMFGSTGLLMLLFLCVCNGFVRDGVIAWAPAILSGARDGLTVSPALLSLVIPLINLIGILLVRRCYPLFHGGARGATGTLLLLGGALALLLPLSGYTVLSAALMGFCCAAHYGVNPMLTTLIPMEYERAGRVGLVAGLVDSFIYIGSALAGVLTGALSDAAGWTCVYLLWGIVSLLGGTLGFLSLRAARKRETSLPIDLSH